MKKIFLIVVGVIALTINTFAQRYLEFGVAGGLGVTDGVDRRVACAFDLNAGLNIESGLGLGIYFTGFMTNREEDSRLRNEFTDCDFCFRGAYGGVYGEQVFLKKSFFYLNAGARLGFGGVNYSNNTVEKRSYDPMDGTYHYTYEKADKSFIMALEPFAGINFELGETVTLSAGAEYRNLFFTNLYCADVHIASGSDLNGMVYFLKLKFRTDF